MTISNTLMFNLKQIIDPLPEYIVKEELVKDDLLKCKQLIFHLLQLESKHETLALPNLGGGRREEHYRLLWEELETFLKAHARNSIMHAEVLNCLLEVRNKNDKDKVELDQALRELDGIGKEETPRASVIRATTDSPMSPPTSTSMSLQKQLLKNNSSKSFLDIWLQRSTPKDKKPEFHGRLNSDGLKAKLYPNFKEPGWELREPMIET
ncbi:hypothetical protein HCN44_010675 [Aphidius gifuensis]|uniref:Protein asunder n=1 Tax=Aphidius gifuensis TaxID=684658 RepID=A0A835CPH2_APHGI|nr:hypothetical protein HCN44_010675 [Aphidius gifuensis]